MKFHWGWGIAIVYTAFVVVMVTLVIKSKSVDHTLVADDYYAQDLAYQQHYEKLANAAALKHKLRILADRQKGEVVLDFPEEAGTPSGKVVFFRPSDKRLDKTLDIRVDESGKMRVPMDELAAGFWRVKV
ncbi:MAG: hypothetical protein D6818_07955, partial [Bacteroidetes bacterium]